MEANQKFHQDLIAGISIDQDIGARRQKQTVRFIDFDDPEKNEFLAVNQFWVKGPKQTDRPDIVLFVNGIPLVVIECKSPVAKQTGISNAVVQLKRYQEEISQLFYYNQICVALNLFCARYGTILCDEEFYHEWKNQGNETFPNMSDHPAVREMLKLELIDKKDLSDSPTAQAFSYLGRQYRLKVIRSDSERNKKCKLVGGRFVVTISHHLNGEKAKEHVKKALSDWYFKRAEEKIPERVNIYIKRLGKQPEKIEIKNHKKRWGSCSRNGVVRFNWKIVMAPVTVLDYVLVHELCHLIYPHHSDQFWKKVGAIIPDYDKRRNRLRGYSIQIRNFD